MRSFILSYEVRVRERKALSTLYASIANTYPVTVTNIKTNQVTEYDSLTEAGKPLGVLKSSKIQSFLKKWLKKKIILSLVFLFFRQKNPFFYKKKNKKIKLYYLLNG